MSAKRELLYPIFLRCVPYLPTEDVFWKETFQDLAYGVTYGGSYITKGVLCSKTKGKEFVYKFNDKEPEHIVLEVTRLLKEKLHIMSRNERKALLDDMIDVKDQLEKIRHLEWADIKKKSMKEILFQNFLIRMKSVHELKDVQVKKLYNTIHLGCLLKSIKNTDVLYSNGDIQEIRGFHFSKGRYRVDMDLYSGLEEEVGRTVEKKEDRRLRYL